MTLNTNFYITTPGIDPNTVWNALLDMVEPENFPRSREDYTESGATPAWGPDGTFRRNTKVGIGLKAWCFMYYNTDGSAIALDRDQTDDERKADPDDDYAYVYYVPKSYIRLDFDTAYGYHDEYGGCSDLHGRIVTHLAEVVTSMGGEYAWQDEYTGEWFTDLSHIPDFGKF